MDRSLSKPRLKREARRVVISGCGSRLKVAQRSLIAVFWTFPQNGAKVIIDIAAEIGTRFGLAMVPHRSKQCEIVWRRGRTLGVKFLS